MGLLALLLWPARGLFAYTACALALYLLVVSVSLNELAMYRRNVFLPFGGQKTAEYLWRYLGLPENRGKRTHYLYMHNLGPSCQGQKGAFCLVHIALNN